MSEPRLGDTEKGGFRNCVRLDLSFFMLQRCCIKGVVFVILQTTTGNTDLFNTLAAIDCFVILFFVCVLFLILPLFLSFVDAFSPAYVLLAFEE